MAIGIITTDSANRLANLASAPSGVSNGTIWYDSVNNLIASYINGSATTLTTAASLMSALVTTDSAFRIANNSDNTKKIAFDASGITTATTRTLKMADANVDLANLTNSNISASAAILYSKLSLTNSIVNADINTAAAIAYSKLAALGGSTNAVLIQNGSGSVAPSAILSTNLFLADGSVPATAAFNLNTHKINNVVDPTSPQDAATKAYVDAAVGSSTPLDGTFRIENTSDPTKKIAFSAAGITTATTRTITMPDANVDLGNLTNSNISATAAIAYSKLNLAASIVNADISPSAAIVYSKLALSNSIVNADIATAAAIAYSKLAALGGSTNAVLIQNGSGNVAPSAILSTNLFLADGSVTATGAFNLGGHAPTNSTTPVNPNDLVNKSYVDNFINATSWKTAALVATTASITLSGEQTIDGVTTSASRVLVKNQSTPSQNGIYVSAAGAWSRSSDMNSWANVPAAAVFVESGTVNADLGFVCTSQPGGTLGTTAITWVQFSSAGAYSADGTTLQLISGVFSIKNGGVGPTQLGTITDGVTLDQSGAGSTLEVKAGGISNTQINASAAIAYSKLAALTTARALQSNSSTGFIEVSAVTNTELGFVSGVTSSIQTQLNAKASSANPQFTGNLDLGDGSGNFIEMQYFDALTITASQTGTALTSLNITAANYSSYIIDYVFKQTTSGFVRTGKLVAAYDGTTVTLSDPQYLETGATGLSFDTTISGGNWQILYSSGANGGTLRARATRMRA